ncbi:helix-turn-helix domain-containing protein [Arthrobacter sp. H5]|uniref:helix-turn-helix transcriptional regulator n=1 Tax=Arthrobacter sp. H5 TaxID=1267973 RepID=UPI001C1E32A4|nr:helix-turn-helix domain-containing protein [Arthrobacter sp. H5]
MWTSGYDPVDFGRYLRARRRHQEMTQAELAEWVGVSRPTLAALENGVGGVSLETALKTLSILGDFFALAPKGTPVLRGDEERGR